MKTNLLIILWKKELIHWKRVGKIINKFNSWFGKVITSTIIIILVSIFHYLFAIMHTLYELVLFIFARNYYRENLKKISLNI